MAQVRIETDDAGVRTLTIDREERRNALDRETLDELDELLRACAGPT